MLLLLLLLVLMSLSEDPVGPGHLQSSAKTGETHTQINKTCIKHLLVATWRRLSHTLQTHILLGREVANAKHS